MSQVELFRGPYWSISHFEQWKPGGIPDEVMQDTDTREAVVKEVLQRFHDIARQNGSKAVWPSQAGCLITTDESESDRGFRYYLWRKQAISATVADRLAPRFEKQDNAKNRVAAGTSLETPTSR